VRKIKISLTDWLPDRASLGSAGMHKSG